MCTKQLRPKLYEENTDKIKGRNRPTIIAGDLNIPHSLMDRTTRQKTNMEIDIDACVHEFVFQLCLMKEIRIMLPQEPRINDP